MPVIGLDSEGETEGPECGIGKLRTRAGRVTYELG